MSLKVKVLENFRLVHSGQVYGPGDTAEVPDQVAKEWVAAGWATEAKTAPKKR